MITKLFAYSFTYLTLYSPLCQLSSLGLSTLQFWPRLQVWRGFWHPDRQDRLQKKGFGLFWWLQESSHPEIGEHEHRPGSGFEGVGFNRFSHRPWAQLQREQTASHLCSTLFRSVPLLNCCILQQLRHCGLFSLQFSSCKHQGEQATVQGSSTVKPRALLKLPATELVTDSVPTVIMKTMVTSGIFHFQGCQALSSAPHQWGRNKSTTSGLFEGCRALWVHPCSG